MAIGSEPQLIRRSSLPPKLSDVPAITVFRRVSTKVVPKVSIRLGVNAFYSILSLRLRGAPKWNLATPISK